MWGNPRPAPEYRMGWSDRQTAAESLRRILRWDFQQIVLSHGDLIYNNAHAAAAAAWNEILEPQLTRTALIRTRSDLER